MATTTGLATEVAALDWYHTLELAPGVVTPGYLDTRPIVGHVPLPARLDGKRCLDVGTFNGFWAFELERRGADEVVGIDVLDPYRWDWPHGSSSETIAIMAQRLAGGRGFEIAKRELGSSVTRLERSVLELDPDQDGTFDLVYFGSLLVHLRDPVTALERVRAICRGTLIVVDGIDPLLSLVPRMPLARLDAVGRPWWWYPNPAGLARLVEAAGFEITEGPRRIYIPSGPGRPRGRRFDPRLLRSAAGRLELAVAHRGDPHAALAARPRN